MKNRKTTKKALLMSALSLLLCFSMLIGTTFAWFTDEVKSGTNQIIAGNLDVDVYYGNPAAKNSIEGVSTLFNAVTLWEPGAVAYENLTVVNLGNLALKYQLAINFTNENTVNGYGLSQVLKVAVVPGGFTGTREEAMALKGTTLADFALPGTLETQNETDVYGIVIYWAPSADDNNWNVNNGKEVSDYKETGKNQLHIDLGIKLVATQLTKENDSFGPDYDKGAAWTGMVDIQWYLDNPNATEYILTSGEELAGLAAIVNGTAVAPTTTYAAREATTIQDSFKGKTIKLGANIDLNEVEWTPIGDNANAFLGNFDGQGYTVSNLFVSNEGWAGLIGHAGKAAGCTVKNVTIDGATILSNRMAGAVVGQIYGSIDNCHVKNAIIMVTPNKAGDSYDNGDKVGGIVGWLGDNGNNRTLTNCTATNVELGAYRDVGGIVGYVASSTTVKGNSVNGITITVDQITNYYEDKDVNAGYIYGRANGTITTENNTDKDSSVDSTYSKNGLTLKADGDGNVTLYLVPESYEDTTVNVPEGVTAIGGYAFAYNANIQKIVLPSTVTTLADRAFRDTSASTVVLNEGLTNISYQAFRNASNVTEVSIPSTVTTISKEAFQNSGITTLTIPATVTTLEYGACRDMKELVSVVIEGNLDIPVYAFRACTKLETVKIQGEDVTFGGGSKGMIFTNKENGDGSAITVTVVNDTVKDRLLAADTAAKDYGGYTIIVDDGFEKVESADELKAALANATAGTKINAQGAELTISDQQFNLPGGITLKNAVIITNSRGGSYIVSTAGGDTTVFENCTFKRSETGANIIAANEDGADLVFNNCTFEGPVMPNMVEKPEGKITFNNCTFKITKDAMIYSGYVNCMGGTHIFNGCTFDFTGGSTMGSNQYVRWNAVNSYSERYSTTVILNGCTFINCGTQRYGSNSTLTVK